MLSPRWRGTLSRPQTSAPRPRIRTDGCFCSWRKARPSPESGSDGLLSFAKKGTLLGVRLSHPALTGDPSPRVAERAAARSREASRRAQPLGICKGRRAVGAARGDLPQSPGSGAPAHVERRLGPRPLRVRERRPGARVRRTETRGRGPGAEAPRRPRGRSSRRQALRRWERGQGGDGGARVSLGPPGAGTLSDGGSRSVGGSWGVGGPRGSAGLRCQGVPGCQRVLGCRRGRGSGWVGQGWRALTAWRGLGDTEREARQPGSFDVSAPGPPPPLFMRRIPSAASRFPPPAPSRAGGSRFPRGPRSSCGRAARWGARTAESPRRSKWRALCLLPPPGEARPSPWHSVPCSQRPRSKLGAVRDPGHPG